MQKFQRNSSNGQFHSFHYVLQSGSPTRPPTCSWKWVGVTLPSKVMIFSLQPSSMDIVIGHRQWGAYQIALSPFSTSYLRKSQAGSTSAYWIPPHLTKPLAQSHFCSFTCLAATSSSFRLQLLLNGRDLLSCCFIFLLCHRTAALASSRPDGPLQFVTAILLEILAEHFLAE